MKRKKPDIRLDFESNISKFTSTNPNQSNTDICNNEVVNNFLKDYFFVLKTLHFSILSMYTKLLMLMEVTKIAFS